MGDSVFDSDSDRRQHFDDPLDRGRVRKGKQDRSWRKNFNSFKRIFFFKVIFGLTSTGQEDFDGHILQQIASGEDGSYLRKVPLSVQVIAILQRLPTTTEKSVTLRGSSSEARRTQKHGYNIGHKSRRKFLRLLKRRLCGA